MHLLGNLSRLVWFVVKNNCIDISRQVHIKFAYLATSLFAHRAARTVQGIKRNPQNRSWRKTIFPHKTGSIASCTTCSKGEPHVNFHSMRP